MDHGSLKWKPMSSFVSTQTIFLFWLSSSWDGWGFPLGPVGSVQISPRLYYHPQAQPQRTPEIVTAHPSDWSHIFQSAQRLYRVEAESVAFLLFRASLLYLCVPDSSHLTPYTSQFSVTHHTYLDCVHLHAQLSCPLKTGLSWGKTHTKSMQMVFKHLIKH